MRSKKTFAASAAAHILVCACIAIAVSGCRCLKKSGSEWVSQGTPRQLTFGAGNDTEAAVFSDGRIAYETDRFGGVQIAVLNPADGSNTIVVSGPPSQMAAYPSWTSDGGIVYSLSKPYGTAAVEVPKNSDIGMNLWLYKDGQNTRLTKGLWRDFTPAVTPDGSKVWFSTSRGRMTIGDGSHLATYDIATGETIEHHGTAYSSGCVAVSPSFSPSGRLVAWAETDGPFANWCIHIGETSSINGGARLTDIDMSCYAPRWSPDGKFIACTGFSIDDAGWGVWVIDINGGRMARLETGDGNSRSPSWTPDGKSLVYENNSTGTYKLYCVDVKLTPASKMTSSDEQQMRGVTTAKTETAADGSVSLVSDNGRQRGEATGAINVFHKPSGLDFGDSPYFVRIKFTPGKRSANPQVICAGYYPMWKIPGWHYFLDAAGHIHFTSRGTDGSYQDVMAGEILELGKPYDVIGIHEPNGRMYLLIDGERLYASVVSATFSLKGAERLVIGAGAPNGDFEYLGDAFKHGGSPFFGVVHSFECGVGTPSELPHPKSVKELMADEEEN